MKNNYNVSNGTGINRGQRLRPVNSAEFLAGIRKLRAEALAKVDNWEVFEFRCAGFGVTISPLGIQLTVNGRLNEYQRHLLSSELRKIAEALSNINVAHWIVAAILVAPNDCYAHLEFLWPIVFPPEKSSLAKEALAAGRVAATEIMKSAWASA